MFKIKIIITTIFILFLINYNLYGGYPTSFNNVVNGDRPINVGHGKCVNISQESTWYNLIHSIVDGAEVLEFDIRLTKGKSRGPISPSNCDYVVYHDPTFHGLSNGSYHTPKAKIEEIQRAAPPGDPNHPRLTNPNLFDRTFHYTRDEILGDGESKVYIYDPVSKYYSRPIFFDQMLDAVSTPGQFTTPRFILSKDMQSVTVQPLSAKTASPDIPLFYLDLKEINEWGRKIEKLDGWDYPMISRPEKEIIEHTMLSLQCLDKKLKEKKFGLDKSFVPVRHPCVHYMAKAISPEMNLMISTDLANPHTPTRDLIKELLRFNNQSECLKCLKRVESNMVTLPNNCHHFPKDTPTPNLKEDHCKNNYQLVEIKYLNHMKDDELIQAAKRYCWKLFYNQIEQTDIPQFYDVERMTSEQKSLFNSHQGVAPNPALIPTIFSDFLRTNQLEDKNYSERSTIIDLYLEKKKESGIPYTPIDKEKLLTAIFGNDLSNEDKSLLLKSNLPLRSLEELHHLITHQGKVNPMIQTNDVLSLKKLIKGGLDHTIGSNSKSHLTFLLDNFTVIQRGEIYEGGHVVVDYDKKRLDVQFTDTSCLTLDPSSEQSKKKKNYFMFIHFIDKDNKILEEKKFDISESSIQSFNVKEKTHRLKIWFKSEVSGMEQSSKSSSTPSTERNLNQVLNYFDSKFGQNFEFPVLPRKIQP